MKSHELKSPIDWDSLSNELKLNPRLSDADRARFEAGWAQHVEGRFEGQVGIATSGSSGEAFGKLIVLSKKAFLVAAAGSNKHFENSTKDVWLKMLPDFHVGGLAIYARSHLCGSTVVESQQDRWSAPDFLREAEQAQATMISLVPTQLYDLVASSLRAPATVKVVLIGGGRLEDSLRLRALDLGWPVYVTYGFTECCSQVATAKSSNSSDLEPLPHVQIRTNEDGRIEVASDALLTGVIRFDANGSTFSNPVVDGWFATEDRGEILPNGVLRISGRTQDFVKIAGEGVIVSRLEETLERLRTTWPLGMDAAVLAVKDERLGAAIILVTDASEQVASEIEAGFNAQVMPYEKIRTVYRVEKVPRSALGKLLRGEAVGLIGRELPANA